MFFDDGEKMHIWFRVFLGLSLLSVLSGFGCSRDREEPGETQSTEFPSMDALLREIQSVDCLFELKEIKEKYALREGGLNKKLLAVLDARRDELVENTDAFPAIPGALDFLGWKIQWMGLNPDRRKGDDREQYRISGYFVVTGKMDRDWTFRIMTKVDECHVSQLPAERQKFGYLNWQIPAATSTWSPGEHHILSTIADLRPIPYYIYARMFYPPELLNHSAFAYGWFADPDVGPLPQAKSSRHSFGTAY